MNRTIFVKKRGAAAFGYIKRKKRAQWKNKKHDSEENRIEYKPVEGNLNKDQNTVLKIWIRNKCNEKENHNRGQNIRSVF